MAVRTERRMRLLSSVLSVVALLLIVATEVGASPTPTVWVGGGGNGEADSGPWHGGPEPGSIGLTLPIFQPVIDDVPLDHSAGYMADVVDLSQSDPIGPGIYTEIGTLGKTAKIHTYHAAEDAGGVGLLSSSMPTQSPQEDPFFGHMEVALSEDDDTYRVGVKFNNHIKVLKFSKDDQLISEFRVNTLGMNDHKGRQETLYCNSTCLPSKNCAKITQGLVDATEFWGLVAHSDTAAVLIRVVDRVWFQLYKDDGTLVQNVDLNLWGSPVSVFQSEPGKLKYGWPRFAHYQNSAFNYPVYYAHYQITESSCTQQGDQLVIIDPTNWKACVGEQFNYFSDGSRKTVSVAYTWSGVTSFSRRLVKVETGDADYPEDIIALSVTDLPYQWYPRIDRKGGINLMAPYWGQIYPTAWLPDASAETLIGDWVYPKGAWNGIQDPYYYIMGGFAIRHCTDYSATTKSCSKGWTGWFAVVNTKFISRYQDPVVFSKQVTPDTPSNVDVIAVHFAAIRNNTYLYAWTQRTRTDTENRIQNFMVVLDGMGEALTPTEEVTNLFTWNHFTEFKTKPNGQVIWAHSWVPYIINDPSGNTAGAPAYKRDWNDEVDKVYIVTMDFSSLKFDNKDPDDNTTTKHAGSDLTEAVVIALVVIGIGLGLVAVVGVVLWKRKELREKAFSHPSFSSQQPTTTVRLPPHLPLDMVQEEL